MIKTNFIFFVICEINLKGIRSRTKDKRTREMMIEKSPKTSGEHKSQISPAFHFTLMSGRNLISAEYSVDSLFHEPSIGIRKQKLDIKT